MAKQHIDLQTTISDIPCGIHVDHFLHVSPFRGPASACDSDMDFYGYTDIEYTILDRKGYPAKWLEKKLTPSDNERIQEEITTYKQEQAALARYDI